MESSSSTTSPLARKADLLAELCQLYERTLLALHEEDLEEAIRQGKGAARVIDQVTEIDRTLADRESTPTVDRLVAQARQLHHTLMEALLAGHDATAATLGETRTLRRALENYGQGEDRTGTRLDVTDLGS